jgi:hypothetical protein
MSYKSARQDIAAQILAGFAANPAIFAHSDQCGWTLVNCTDAEIAAYAVRLAGWVMEANDKMGQHPLPSQTEASRDG